MASPADLIEWGAASRPRPGEAEAADRYVVSRLPERVLIGVIDGLGHGPEACHAARIAGAVLGTYTQGPLAALFQRCHARLVGTRGVVMSVVVIDRSGELTWLGVGNVDGVVVRGDPHSTRRHEHLLCRGGVVGYELPALRPGAIALLRGDTLYLTTDGVRRDFDIDRYGREPAQRVADAILHRHASGEDDALILVARYLLDS